MPKENTSRKNKTNRKLGLRIKHLRNELAISQNELGLRADVPKSTIGRIETSSVSASVITLDKIAKALGVPIKELFDF